MIPKIGQVAAILYEFVNIKNFNKLNYRFNKAWRKEIRFLAFYSQIKMSKLELLYTEH